jgi:hypothetical protein
MRKFMVRALPVAGALAGAMVLAPGLASAATGFAVLNLTVPGPVGGSDTCLNGTCIDLQGVANVHISAAASVNTLGLPLVTLGQAPGCTDSLISIRATVHPLALSGTVSVTVSYDRTNANGSVIAGSHTSVTKTIPLTAGGPPVTVSECAAAI